MIFDKYVMTPLLRSLSHYEKNNAFCIGGKFYTYLDLAMCISKIREKLSDVSDSHIGLVANDDLDTYASIFALWIEGKCYVPLHPEQPIDRCLDIISQVEITVILDSSYETRYNEQSVIMTSQLRFERMALNNPHNCRDE